MNRAGLLREVLLGPLLIVGEFRGAHAAMDGYVDRTTGEKIGYVKAIILAECQVRGNLEQFKLNCSRRPTACSIPARGNTPGRGAKAGARPEWAQQFTRLRFLLNRPGPRHVLSAAAGERGGS